MTQVTHMHTRPETGGTIPYACNSIAHPQSCEQSLNEFQNRA